MRERKDKHIVIMDLSVPRTVDSNVRTLDGVIALRPRRPVRAMDKREERRTMLPVAERIIAEEAAGFRTKLLSESVLPTISAMRERLELICHQEMDQLTEQFGPFTEDQEVALETLFDAHRPAHLGGPGAAAEGDAGAQRTDWRDAAALPA